MKKEKPALVDSSCPFEYGPHCPSKIGASMRLIKRTTLPAQDKEIIAGGGAVVK
jgi:hypothetical protein